ncbi:hypothetical protein ACFL47_02620 [Candidatus Latescibacterota bacterium]
MSGSFKPIAPNAPITNALLTNKPGFHVSSDPLSHITISPQKTSGNNIGHYYPDGSLKMFNGAPGAWLIK